MATIGSSPTSASQLWNTTSSTRNASTSGNTSKSTSSGSDSLANESTFLTLLVAQLKNQDPQQPTDGTQFVTQLAQFSDLEQNLAMRTDLDAIRTKLDGSSTSASSSANTSLGSIESQAAAAGLNAEAIQSSASIPPLS